MPSRWRFHASLLALLLAVGCSATTTPKTRYFLIAADHQNQKLQSLAQPPQIRIDCAPFLSQGGLVIENSDQTIQTAHYHRWAESLPAMISRYLQRTLQGSLNPATKPPVINILVDQFHRTTAGHVVFSGQWWVSGQMPQGFSYQLRPPEISYDSMVTTLRQLLDTHSHTMAKALAALE